MDNGRGVSHDAGKGVDDDASMYLAAVYIVYVNLCWRGVRTMGRRIYGPRCPVIVQFLLC